jgi:cell wall-associated NlpC family hydrolase
VTRARFGAALAASVCVVAGCGAATQPDTGNGNRDQSAGPSQATALPTFHAHPQAVSPVAGGAASDSGSGAASVSGVSVQTPAAGALAKPISLERVKDQLAQSGLTANNQHATLTPEGLAIAPLNAPPQIQEVVDAGNEIAHLPYVWGGGHGRFVDTGYDCSGSLSFIFAAAGIVNTSMTSGEFAHWGAAGPGKWITVFANNGHTFAYIAGLRFDTVALAQSGTRWSSAPGGPGAGDGNGFAIRHPPGM